MLINLTNRTFCIIKLLKLHLFNQKELKVTTEITKESINFTKYQKFNALVKYSAYWCHG